MRQRVVNTFPQQLRHLFNPGRAEVATDDVPAHRQWQTVFLMPPLTEVKNFVQTLRLVKKLTLVNQQARIAGTVQHGVNDLVERHDFILEIRIEDSEGKKSTRQLSRNRNFEIGYV